MYKTLKIDTIIINRVHAPTMVNGCTIYEEDPLNTVGCRMGTRTGWMDVCIAYLIHVYVSGEARCTAFFSDTLMKSSSCSYFP